MDPGRHKIFRIALCAFVYQLKTTGTDLELVQAIQEYLMAHGRKILVDCLPLNLEHTLLAKMQDKLG